MNYDELKCHCGSCGEADAPAEETQAEKTEGAAEETATEEAPAENTEENA